MLARAAVKRNCVRSVCDLRSAEDSERARCTTNRYFLTIANHAPYPDKNLFARGDILCS